MISSENKMAILDEIRRMKQEGRSEQEIALDLKQRGFQQRDIADSLSQMQIKEAVSPPFQDNYTQQDNFTQQEEYNSPEYQLPDMPNEQQMMNMQPSMMDQQIPQPSGNYQEQYPREAYPEDQYPQEAYQENNHPQDAYPTDQYLQDAGYDYQQYSSSPLSSDTISEIADQIISEKLAGIRDQLEDSIDSKTTAETKLSHLDERLQRIEKIIDRLQLSILQKVGEYATSVSDLKKEVIETQKSFKAVHHQTTSHHHTENHPHNHIKHHTKHHHPSHHSNPKPKKHKHKK